MSDDQDSGAAAGGAATDYETATARLDEIIARLDSGDAQLRETLDLCAEAKTLIEYCAAELAAVDDGRALEATIKAAGDDNPQVRAEALRSLAKKGGPEAFEALVAARSDLGGEP